MTTIINTAVALLTSTIIGYFGSQIKKVFKEVKILKESQMQEMKSRIASNFYVYEAMDKVEDYLATGFWELCERYFDLGGDTYIHSLYEKSKTWGIKQTGYLK